MQTYGKKAGQKSGGGWPVKGKRVSEHLCGTGCKALHEMKVKNFIPLSQSLMILNVLHAPASSHINLVYTESIHYWPWLFAVVKCTNHFMHQPNDDL
jgi:hypothetical protein